MGLSIQSKPLQASGATGCAARVSSALTNPEWSRSAPPAAAPAGGYSGRKLTCRQIGSYARAQELLRQGHGYLDKNGDGVACESLR